MLPAAGITPGGAAGGSAAPSPPGRGRGWRHRSGAKPPRVPPVAALGIGPVMPALVRLAGSSRWPRRGLGTKPGLPTGGAAPKRPREGPGGRAVRGCSPPGEPAPVSLAASPAATRFLRGSARAGGPREASSRGPGSGGTGTGFVKGFLRASEANPAVTWCRGSALPLASDAGRAAAPRGDGGGGGGLHSAAGCQRSFGPSFGLGDNRLTGSEALAGPGRETGKTARKNSVKIASLGTGLARGLLSGPLGAPGGGAAPEGSGAASLGQPRGRDEREAPGAPALPSRLLARLWGRR